MEYWGISGVVFTVAVPILVILGAWQGYKAADEDRSINDNIGYAWFMFCGMCVGVLVALVTALAWILIVPLAFIFGVLVLVVSQIRKRKQ